jgi:hypothetical protein
MQIAIITDSGHSYPRVMAEGLQRMLGKLNVQSTLFYNGHNIIRKIDFAPSNKMKFARSVRNVWLQSWLRRYARTWANYDALVIVGHSPGAFMRGFWNDTELRQLLPNQPIVLYDLVYLPTRGSWARWLREGNPSLGIPSGGHFGLERYDWYLCASVVSEYPLVGADHPISNIGLDLDDGSLYVSENNNFMALLDFARGSHMDKRRVQKAALHKSGIKWIELTGQYSISAIRAIYRKCNVYFVAHRESFGLPICETQACGSYVFTPYADWCPSHWTKSDLSIAGAGALSRNFVVYDNDSRRLSDELSALRACYNPFTVRERFLQTQSQFYFGNLSELGRFIDLLDRDEIHPQLHLDHRATII